MTRSVILHPHIPVASLDGPRCRKTCCTCCTSQALIAGTCFERLVCPLVPVVMREPAQYGTAGTLLLERAAFSRACESLPDQASGHTLQDVRPKSLARDFDMPPLRETIK